MINDGLIKISDLLSYFPSDKHWGNRTTVHETELENERFDQGFNDCLMQIKNMLKRYQAWDDRNKKRIEFNNLNKEKGGVLGPTAPPIPFNFKQNG